MTGPDRDLGLDTLLDLNGQTLFVDELGHWMKFIVLRTEVTPERPHGLSYSLTLHAPDGAKLVGFDNVHWNDRASLQSASYFARTPASRQSAICKGPQWYPVVLLNLLGSVQKHPRANPADLLRGFDLEHG